MKKDFDDDRTRDIFDDPLQRMKKEWRETIEGDGGCCPVCGQFGKVYRMRLTQTMALAVKWIADHGNPDGWVEVQSTGPRWMIRGKTYSMIAHWGLIESQSRRSGIWRVTPKGRDFLSGKVLVPDAVYIYDNDVWAVSKDETSFRGCFGVNFDFDELMSTQFKWSNVAQLEKSDANA
jgi:hypothetical protein